MPPKRQLAQRSRNRNSKVIKKQLPKQSLIEDDTEAFVESGSKTNLNDNCNDSSALEKNKEKILNDENGVLANQNFQMIVSSCMTFCKEIVNSTNSQKIRFAKKGEIEASFLLGNSEIQLLRNHISKKYNGRLETMFNVTQIEFLQDLDLFAVPVVENKVKIVCNFEDNIDSYYDSAGRVACTILYIIFYLFTFTNRIINPNYVSNSFESNYELNFLINKFDYLENDKILHDLNESKNDYAKVPLLKFVDETSPLKEFSVSENETFEFSNFFSIILKGELESIGKCIIHLLTNYYPQDEISQQNSNDMSTLRNFCKSRCYFLSNQDDLNDEFSDVKSALQNLLFKDDKFLRIPFTGIFKDPDLILHLDEGEADQEEKINKEMVESSRLKMLQYIQRMQQQLL